MIMSKLILVRQQTLCLLHSCYMVVDVMYIPFINTEMAYIENLSRNHTPSKVWKEITYRFLIFNRATIEVWEWINNFIPHFIMDVV